VPVVFAALFTTLVVAGCGNEPPTASHASIDSLVWRAQMTPHGGLNVALGDSVQATIVGLNLDKQPLPLDSIVTVTYSTDDSTSVGVSPTGVITGRQVTFSPIRVVATVTGGNVNSADTVYVQVTATREVVDSISFVTDSLRGAVLSAIFFRPTAWGGGAPLADVYVYPSTDDPSVFLDPVFDYMYGLAVRPVWMHVMTTAYGRTFSDSVQYTFLIPAAGYQYVSDLASGGFSLNPDWSNVTVTFQKCASITWYNTSSKAFDVTFSDPQNTGQCGVGDVTDTGNIVALQPNASATRKFPAAGSHTWSIAASDNPNKILNTGTIVTQ
jgi:hypothetical protein